MAKVVIRTEKGIVNPKPLEKDYGMYVYNCRNVVRINGVKYFGKVTGSIDFINTIKYLDYMAEISKNQPKTNKDHPDTCIGILRGG